MILKGKEVADAINEEVSEAAKKLTESGMVPTLGIVRVGERPDDLAYERGAVSRAEKVGIKIKRYVFDADVSQSALIAAIKKINADSAVNGVLLFRPLPDTINEDTVRNALDFSKDVDGITDISQAGVYSGNGIGYPPCTAEACIEILDHFETDIEGKRATIIGRSLVIGKPVTMMLIQRHATVTVCHTRTRDIPSIARESEILIAAAGSEKMVTAEYMNSDQVIIDVGINVDEDGKLCGDVDAGDAEKNAKAYTPVPGGVGTVTTSLLMKHTVDAARKQHFMG